MQLQRSEKAKSEIGGKGRQLGLKERQALFLADGKRSMQDLNLLLQDDGTILQKLIESGYLLQMDGNRAIHEPEPAIDGKAAEAPGYSRALVRL